MTLTPTDLTIIATVLLAIIVMAMKDDPRAWQWLKAQWQRTRALAAFANRRLRRGVHL